MHSRAHIFTIVLLALCLALAVTGCAQGKHAAKGYIDPVSGHAVPGKKYNMVLSTHCGVDWRVDFDGSFWKAADKRWARAGKGASYPLPINPEQKGAMELVSADSARFDWPAGHIFFKRRVGAMKELGCM